MSISSKFNSLLALFASLLLSIFGKAPSRPTSADLLRTEFKTSTQRLGIRFTERIRDIFRFRWLKKR